MPTPSTPPTQVSSALSAKSCRTRRPGSAPSAARVASSSRRASARASRMFVTLAHAIASSSSTAPRIASSAGRTPLVTDACSDSSARPRCIEAQVGRGNSAAGELPIASISRCACSSVTPSRKPADHSQIVSPLAALERLPGEKTQRRPDFDGRAQSVLEALGHDADDRVALAVERDRAVEHGLGAAEAAFGEARGDDHDGRRSRDVVRGGEVASERGPYAEGGEIVGTDEIAFEPRRLAGRRERRLPTPHDGERVERAIALHDLEERSVGDRKRPVIVVAVREHDHALGLRIRQRAEEDLVDGAEDRGADTDAEADAEDRDERAPGARAAEQLSPRVPQVGNPRLHRAPSRSKPNLRRAAPSWD